MCGRSIIRITMGLISVIPTAISFAFVATIPQMREIPRCWPKASRGRGPRYAVNIATVARPILARLKMRLLQGFDEREIDVVKRFLNSIVRRF